MISYHIQGSVFDLLILSYIVIDCHRLSYIVISYHILSYLILSCHILPYPGLCFWPACPSEALAHVDPKGPRAFHQDANFPRRWGGYSHFGKKVQLDPPRISNRICLSFKANFNIYIWLSELGKNSHTLKVVEDI